MAVKQAFDLAFGLSFVIAHTATINLWLNYKDSLSKQVGISIRNQISYWIITDNVVWTQTLFLNYFYYALIISLIMIGVFLMLRKRGILWK